MFVTDIHQAVLVWLSTVFGPVSLFPDLFVSADTIRKTMRYFPLLLVIFPMENVVIKTFIEGLTIKLGLFADSLLNALIGVSLSKRQVRSHLVFFIWLSHVVFLVRLLFTKLSIHKEFVVLFFNFIGSQPGWHVPPVHDVIMAVLWRLTSSEFEFLLFFLIYTSISEHELHLEIGLKNLSKLIPSHPHLVDHSSIN